MKINLNISESEKNQILLQHNKYGYTISNLDLITILKEQTQLTKSDVILDSQKILKNLGYNLGNYGPNKDGLDGKLGMMTRQALSDFQRKNNITPNGRLNTITYNKLKSVGSVNVQNIVNQNSRKSTNPVNTKNTVNHNNRKSDNYDPLNDPKKHKTNPSRITERCIAISPEECKKKVFSNKETVLGTGSSEIGCSKYAIKCLSQYDKDIPRGNAWKLSQKMRQFPSKYDMFQSEIDWNKIHKLIKDRQITKTGCSKYIDAEHADNTYPEMKKIIQQFYPSSSKFNSNILELGDIVGIYWKSSSNMGTAFCERAVKDRGLDDRGNIESDYFSFNTHVGFVGAIKNNVPIIFHYVDGTYLSTPINLLNGMITWVKTDPVIKNAILQQEKNNN